MLGTLMIPPTVLLLPVFLQPRDFGLINFMQRHFVTGLTAGAVKQ